MTDKNFVEQTIGNWTSYQDDNQQIYYYNNETGESTWDAPPGFSQDDNVEGDVSESVSNEDAVGDSNEINEPQEEQSNSDNVNEIGISKSPPINSEETVAQAEDATNTNNTDNATNNEEEEIVDGQEIGNGWVAYKDEEQNSIYYYNTELNETQWERPDVTTATTDDADVAGDVVNGGSSVGKEVIKDELLDDAEQRDDGDDVKELPEKAVKQDETSEHKTSSTTPATQEKKEQTSTDTSTTDTTSTKINKAKTFLNQPDAVMEPNVLNYISQLVTELGPQVAGPQALQSLINGYVGTTSVCGVLGLWLAELKSDSSSVSSTASSGSCNEDAFQQGANNARNVTEQVINRLSKERFTKDYGDAIMNLSKKEASFIDNMINSKSDRWRNLLIDLSATNKDSKLFMYCLQSISNLGYHRAIANRIQNQSDSYFGVFNSMLQSELIIAGKVAVDGYTKEVCDSIVMNDYDIGSSSSNGNSKKKKESGGHQYCPMGSLISDLQRTCTSTSYTYLYAMEVLGELISESNKVLLTKDDDSTEASQHRKQSLEGAIRKWERLREELEDEMFKPQVTGTTFQRKRRLDVALTMSDLFQRKRRRVDPKHQDETTAALSLTDKDDNENTLDVALSQLLTKNSLGIPLDKDTIDNVLKFAYGGSTDRIGDLLIKHPTAVKALLGNLFGPSKRIRQLEIRLKCSRLVALAVTASERLAAVQCHPSTTANDNSKSHDENDMSQIILKASQLCEQLENMVSFTVLDSIDTNTSKEGSIGRQLSALCIQHPAVASGVLVWMKELASGSEFVSTASYPTISPCILSLARLISIYHPLTRPVVLEISLIFMSHSNREISHRKMESIKEQCLRLMLWLSAQGLVLDVISALSWSDMDSALIRYFFMGILEIVQAPLSLSFVRALGGLMLKTSCVDALTSKHFVEKEQIVQLIDMFDAAFDCQEGWDEDEALLSTLKSTYTQ